MDKEIISSEQTLSSWIVKDTEPCSVECVPVVCTKCYGVTLFAGSEEGANYCPKCGSRLFHKFMWSELPAGQRNLFADRIRKSSNYLKRLPRRRSTGTDSTTV